MGWLVLAANVAPKTQLGDILIPALWLVAGLVLAAGILVAVRKWGRPTANPTEDVHEQLARFRRAYQQGQMDKSEYERVHALLAEKIRLQTGITHPEGIDKESRQTSRPPREAASFEPDEDSNESRA
jgi:hypothetical protein